MKVFWNIDRVVNKVDNKVEKALTVIGAAAVSHVTARIRKNKSIVSSNLINSITYSTSTEQLPVSQGDGKSLREAPRGGVKIGTTVVYGPRVEFGFVGTDSLGRNYNQPAKSFLRSSLLDNKTRLNNLFSLMMRKK